LAFSLLSAAVAADKVAQVLRPAKSTGLRMTKIGECGIIFVPALMLTLLIVFLLGVPIDMHG
jgi:hypothetical protein